MDPQAPNIPTEGPFAPKNPQIPQPARDNHWISILAMAIFVLLALGAVAFLYYQNQQLKSMLATYQAQATPTPSATPDVTANWKTYTNSYWEISLKYPQDKLTSCPSYTTESEGIRFFSFGFSCPNGTDVVYKVGVVGYKPGQYKEVKAPSTSQQVVVDGKTATRKMYIYDKSDGPLFGQKESQEIVFNLDKGTLVLEQWGDNLNDKQIFDQILSTFKFLGVPTPTASSEGKVTCPAKRPEVCTMECMQNPPYICGSDEKSYCSVCQACSNEAVKWYVIRATPCSEGIPF